MQSKGGVGIGDSLGHYRRHASEGGGYKGGGCYDAAEGGKTVIDRVIIRVIMWYKLLYNNSNFWCNIQ